MEKVILILLLSLFIISCEQDVLILNNGIGNIKLGQALEFDYDKNEFDITLDENKLVRTIIINSSKYKTKDGFGVGSNIDYLKDKYNIPINKYSANKGKAPIIDLGRNIVHDKIIYIDNNKDDVIDFIILNKE